MRKLVSGFALVLVSLGLAACGGSNDPVANGAVSNETVLNDEFIADENLTISDDALLGDGAGLGNGLEPDNAAAVNAL